MSHFESEKRDATFMFSMLVLRVLPPSFKKNAIEFSRSDKTLNYCHIFFREIRTCCGASNSLGLTLISTGSWKGSAAIMPTVGLPPSSSKAWEEAAENKMLARPKETCVGHRKAFDATESGGTLGFGGDRRERGSRKALPRQRELTKAAERSIGRNCD